MGIWTNPIYELCVRFFLGSINLRVFWVGFYGLLMLALFFFGLLFRDYAWAAFFVLPLTSSVVYSYFGKEVKKALLVIIPGLLLFGVSAAILGGVLINHELFWGYLDEMPYYDLSITTYDVALSYLAVMIVGFMSLQVPLQAFGVCIGVFAHGLRESLLPTEERLDTSGDFTREGVTRTGVSKMRVISVVPTDLVEWMNEEISKGNYTNQSHIMEVALRGLKENEQES